MVIQSHIAVVRAVGSQFLADLVRPIAWVVIGVMVVLLAVSLWLNTVDALWWLLAGWMILLVPVISILFLAIWFVIKRLQPELDAEQRQAVREFTAKLRTTVEDLRTPWPWIAAKIAYDVLFPGSNGYLTRLVRSTKTLYPDYRKLQALFALKQKT